MCYGGEWCQGNGCGKIGLANREIMKLVRRDQEKQLNFLQDYLTNIYLISKITFNCTPPPLILLAILGVLV